MPIFTKNETKSPNAPVAKLRIGSVSASVWQNTVGKDRFYSVTFERSYQAKDGNWQSSRTFNTDELLVLAKLADMAHTEIIELRSRKTD